MKNTDVDIDIDTIEKNTEEAVNDIPIFIEEGTNIVKSDVGDEMKKSYLDYSMSVIASRAIPDVRDGLKPVHRRILFAMEELGLVNNKPHRKSARIVGDVLGKLHPHGDTAVYDAMVRLAQDFSTRYMLVDGHGNFGSTDGDKPAAMRYTEARMTKITKEILGDIDKKTVDFKLNFDESMKEPVVLPAKLPNLLINGTNGIAVGMATSIPPHNLNETVDGIIATIDNNDISTDELMTHIKAPDFPTNGVIMGTNSVKEAYETGRGKCIIRAKAHIEDIPGNRSRIIVTEIPYQVNKANLVKKIAELVRDKKIEDISDLRDESDRNGIRVVIDLKRNATPQVVLNNLYKQTSMQTTFSMIMLALDENSVPRVFSLKEIIQKYIEHRVDVIKRKTEYELKDAKFKKEITGGLIVALDNVDKIINIIKKSDNVPSAKQSLIKEFSFTDNQVKEIVDMKLSKLTKMEATNLLNKMNQLDEMIEEYTRILSDRQNILDIIKDELAELKRVYGDERRSIIIEDTASDIDIIDLIQKQDIVITFTNRGYIKRMPLTVMKKQNRGGQGSIAIPTKMEDYIEQTFSCTTHDTLLAFTEEGSVYKLRVCDVPEASKQAKGISIVNLLPISLDTKIKTLLPITGFDESKYLIFATKSGMVKRTSLSEYVNIRTTGIIAINLNEGDSLNKVILTEGDKELLVFSRNGMVIRYREEEIRPTGRNTSGVRGIKLNTGDNLIDMQVVEDDKYLIVLTEKGYGKKTLISEYRSQNRGGKGYGAYKKADKNGDLVGAEIVDENSDVLIITKKGVVMRIPVSQVTNLSRYTIGSSIISLTDGDSVSELALVKE